MGDRPKLRRLAQNRRISSAQDLRAEIANSKRWTGAKIALMVVQSLAN
jgi:hypothetical protein